MPKLLHLTKEEIDYFKEMENDFFRKYTLQDKIPLYRRIATSLHSLAVKKLIDSHNLCLMAKKQEAIDHHLKARKYYFDIKKSCPAFIKETGLI